MHSWRVLLLPYMEQTAFYNRYKFNEPWNGPNNITLLNSMPSTFACPSRFSQPTNLTSYVAVTGPGTMFPGTESTKFDDVTDGTSNTLMILEVSNANIPWTAPVDLDVRTMSFQINDRKRGWDFEQAPKRCQRGRCRRSGAMGEGFDHAGQSQGGAHDCGRRRNLHGSSTREK